MGLKKLFPKDYLDLTTIEEIQSSPNYVIWIEKTPKDDTTGYQSRIVRYDKSKRTKRTITWRKALHYHPRISPNESHLGFLSNRNGFPQLFIIPMDGGEAEPITDKYYKLISFCWSPNGSKIAFIAKIDPDRTPNEFASETNDRFEQRRQKLQEEIIHQKHRDPRVITNLVYRTGTEFLESWLSSQVFVYDPESGIVRISSVEFDYEGVHWTSPKTLVAFTKLDSPRDLSDYLDLVELRIDQQHEGQRISKSYHPYIFEKPIVVNPHDRSMICIQTYEKTYNRGIRYQILKWGILEDGQLKIINKDLDRSLVDLEWVDNETALTLINHHGIAEVRGYDHSTGEFSQLYSPRFSVEGFSGQSLNDFCIISTSPRQPSAVWRFDGENMELLHDPNREFLANKKIVEPEVIWFENDEGTRYQGWFFNADQNRKNPLILSIHGGPHIMWNNAGSMWMEWQSQLSAGYSILALNPVGSDGFGEEYMRVIVGEWGNKDARDLLKALDSVIEDRNVEPNRIYVTGGSYAGYQTVNLIALDQRFRAACAQRGVYNLLTLDAGGDLARFDEIEYLGPGPKNIDKLWRDSPISRVEHITTPLLLMHSENDYRVPIHQAEHLFVELRRRGLEVEFVRYPGEGHDLSRSGQPYHLIDRLERIILWFDNHR